MAAPSRRPVPFNSFGGIRLDQSVDEVSPGNAIFLKDVDWDGSPGRIRPRFGFQKLKASELSGTTQGFFPHSAIRALITKRISAGSLKLVAIDKELVEKTEKTLNSTAAKSTFAHYGTPSAAYTYMRTNTPEQKVVRFDGTTFTEPTATIVSVNEFGEESRTATKEMPKGALHATWPDAGNVLVIANTGTEGGPNKAKSSSSHVWISKGADPEFPERIGAEEWEERGFIQVSPGDGEEITEVSVWGGQLFVFKETKYFVVYGVSAIEGTGQPEYHFREVSLGEGARMKRATSELLAETSDRLSTPSPNGLYFCTTDGIYVTTGGQPSKVSQPLKPLEEITPFDGPMAEFLNGSSESFRWPATGITTIGTSILVKRYEFIFKYDIPTGDWTCWKVPAVSMAAWIGLSGGGAEVSPVAGPPQTTAEVTTGGINTWTNLANLKTVNGVASTTAGGGSASLNAVLTNFSLSLPSGAIPVGVAFSFEHSCSPAEAHATLNHVRLVKGGTIQTVVDHAPGTFAPSGFTKVSFGGAEDLWGVALTRADVVASNFGVAIVYLNTSGTAEVRNVLATVYYTTSEAAAGVRPRLFCTQAKTVLAQFPEAKEESTAGRDAQWQSGYYDIEDEDEKSLVEGKLWGKGTITLASYKDFKEEAGFEEEIEIGTTTGVGWNHMEHTGTMFSHRLKLAAGSAVQRFVRYLLERRDPTTGTDTR